jgi:Protein of unknown function (DUF3102)
MIQDMTDTTTDIARSNLLTDIAHRINEAHHLAMRHAGEAVAQAIACGKMLVEAKNTVPHGQWLPWLRQNVTFGERSAQGYMRLAKHNPDMVHATVRDALKELAAPRRYNTEALLDECDLWNVHAKRLAAGRPDEPGEWSPQDAKNCADIIRGYDSIFHRHGICVPEDCLICDAGLEANTQRVADMTLLARESS